MKSKIVEMKLEDLELLNRGSYKGKEDVIIISFNLVYPREGVASLSTVKKFGIKKPIPNFSKEPYASSILFKEAFRGKCQLIVKATAIDKPSEFDKLMRKIFKGVATVMLGKVTAGIGNVVLAAASGTAGEFLLNQVTAEHKSVQQLGVAVFDLDSEKLPKKPQKKVLEVPKDVVKMKGGVHPVSGEPEKEKEIILKKGSNGSIKISVNVIG